MGGGEAVCFAACGKARSHAPSFPLEMYDRTGVENNEYSFSFFKKIYWQNCALTRTQKETTCGLSQLSGKELSKAGRTLQENRRHQVVRNTLQ